MEPASTIIAKLGGAAKVSEMAGVHRSRVYSWMKPKAEGGTDGMIPFWHAPRLIEGAKALKIDLDAADFLPPIAKAS